MDGRALTGLLLGALVALGAPAAAGSAEARTAAPAAAAGPREDARAAAEAFFAASARGDGRTICAAVTPAYDRELGGGKTCLAAFEEQQREEAADADARARGALTNAYLLAVSLARRPVHANRFPAPARIVALARTTRPPLRLAVGRGAAAARNRAPELVVIDAARSTGSLLVLHCESDTGAIFRLEGRLTGRPRIARTTTAGVPRPPDPPRRYTIDGVELGDGGHAFVTGTFETGPVGETRVLLRLVVLDGAWKVDGVYSGTPVLRPL